jgi:CubicO group peptidase (beta-lactamase class C family)
MLESEERWPREVEKLSTFPRASAALREAIARRVTPGGVFGVLHRGAVIAVEGEGRLTYEPDSPAVSAETSYDLASLTKVVATTATAMLLWQRGRLDLDTLLGDLLPGFVIGTGDAARRRRITLRMLLAHASGLPASIPFYRSCSTPESILRAALHLPLEADPGTRSAYSDPGFILLGKALEQLAATSLDRFARDEIFVPLGMRHTRFRPAKAEKTGIPPTEEDKAFRGRTVQGEVHDENCFVLGGVSGHAGLFATANDLLLFANAMLTPLRDPSSGTLFLPDTVGLFTRRAEFPRGSTRALGWDTPSPNSSSGSFFDSTSFGHLGFTGTSLWIDPARDLAVVLLTNRTFPTRETAGIQTLRPQLHDAVAFDLQEGTLASDRLI